MTAGQSCIFNIVGGHRPPLQCAEPAGISAANCANSANTRAIGTIRAIRRRRVPPWYASRNVATEVRTRQHPVLTHNRRLLAHAAARACCGGPDGFGRLARDAFGKGIGGLASGTIIRSMVTARADRALAAV